MRLSLLYPALLSTAILCGTPLADTGCKLPISPSDVQTILTGEQIVCVLAADFVPDNDVQTVLRFCGYVGPITQDVINIVNALFAARPKVWVDPVTHAHYRAQWRAFQAKSEDAGHE